MLLKFVGYDRKQRNYNSVDMRVTKRDTRGKLGKGGTRLQLKRPIQIWHSSEKTQERAVQLAKNVECLRISGSSGKFFVKVTGTLKSGQVPFITFFKIIPRLFNGTSW